MLEKKSHEYSAETHSIASTSASIKSKLSNILQKLKRNKNSDKFEENKKKGPSINYQATSSYMALKS